MKNASPIRVLAGGAAVVSAGLGLFVLAAWVLGRWHLAILGADSIPMAPITALLFVVLGLALGVRLWWEGSWGAELLAMAGAGAAALAGAAELAGWAYGFLLPWNLWGVGVETGFGVMEIGRMAPLTAATFLLAAVALAAQGAWLGRHRAARWIASLATSAGLVIGGLVILAYAAGTPLGYGPGTVPMALLTALAFVVLHAGIVLADKGGELLRVWREPDDEPAGTPQDQRFFTPRMILVLAAIATTSGLGGFFYLRNEQTVVRRGVHAQLLSIAELNASQITTWRRERLGDARVVAAVPGLAEIIAEQSAEPPGVESPRWAQLAVYLKSLQEAFGYRQIVLFDRSRNVVGVFPAGAVWDKDMAPLVRKKIVEARDVVVEDLDRGRDGRIEMHMLSQLKTNGGRDLAGVVLITADSDTLAFPLGKKWPTPTATGEVMLVRREGGTVLSFADLRPVQGADPDIYRSRTQSTVVAIQALPEGSRALIEFTDYRGVAALGVAHRVPDSPWTLVAKMDKAEAYAPVREEAMIVFVGFGFMMAIGALFKRTWWQQRQRDLTRRQLSAERAARAASERLALVMRHANDVILLFDDTARIVESNDRVLAAYGRTPAEMRELTAQDLRSEKTAALVERDFAAALTEEGITFETIHRRKDGSTFPVEVSSRAVEIEGRRHVLSVIRDITQRRIHEGEITRLSQMFHLISAVNKVLVHAKTRAGLFAEICRVMVELGQFRIAWIGWLNPETRFIDAVEVRGDEHGFVPGIRISVDPALPEGRGPSGTALREGRAFVCNDFLADPATESWREPAARSGLGSAIALPLQCEGECVGLLTVYAAEREFFHPRKVELLEEAAGDISFALGVFAGEARQREAEAELRKLSLAVEQNPATIVITDLRGSIEYVNPQFCAVSGYTREEVLGQNPRVLKSGLTPPATYVEMWRTLLRGQVWRGELSNKKKTGEVYFESAVIAPVTDETGKVSHYVAVKEDITAKKAVEDSLRESEERFRELFDLESDAILVIDSDSGRIVQANQAAAVTYGCTVAELVTLCSMDVTAEPEKIDDAHEAAVRDLDKVLKVPIRLHRKRDGTVFPVEINARPFRRDGRFMQVAVIRDVTEQVKAREQLQRFNAELEGKVVERTTELAARNREIEALLQSIPDMVMRLRTDGGIVYLQHPQGSAEFAALALDGPQAGVHPALLASAMQVGHGALAADAIAAAEAAVGLDDNKIIVELRAAPIGRAEFVVFVRDITERKQLVDALKESNDRLYLAAQAGRVGIWDYYAGDKKLVWDDQMFRLYGTTRDRSGGAYDTWRQGMHPHDRQRGDEEIQLALRGEKDFDTEFRVVWPDGSIHDIRALALVQCDTEGRPVHLIGTNWDITAQKRLEAEIAAALEKERELSEMKTRFISMTSHEFRTPMAAAMGSAYLLANHLDRLAPAKRQELIGRITFSLHRMTEMLDEVLTLNRMEANRTEVRLAPVELRAFAQNAIEEIRLGDRDAHRFELHAGGDTGGFVTDPNMLHHILTNLLSNAVRYSPRGAEIATRIEADEQQVRIAVEDQGIGIPEADRARIFEPFERGSNVGNIKGTGLGLNIVQRMTGLLGGTVAVEAAVGGGTRFTLIFPRAVNPPASS